MGWASEVRLLIRLVEIGLEFGLPGVCMHWLVVASRPILTECKLQGEYDTLGSPLEPKVILVDEKSGVDYKFSNYFSIVTST